MNKSKGGEATGAGGPKVTGEWRKHLQRIAGARSSQKTAACRDNLAKARLAKQAKRLAKFVTSSPEVHGE